jgi:hypothetical protein
VAVVDERLEIHRLYLEAQRCEQEGLGSEGHGKSDSGRDNSGTVPFVWAETTQMASTRICHPQVRPRGHQRVSD